MTDINYNLLPEHIRAGAKRYIEDNIKPGHFLQAAFADEFVTAILYVDDICLDSLPNIASFMYNECPQVCRGSREKVEAWCNGRKAT